MSKTALVVGAMASAMVLACMAAVLTAKPGVGKPHDGDAGRRGRYQQLQREVRTAKRQVCWAKYGEPSSPSATTPTPTAPARSSATATIRPGASTRSAPGPRLATTSTTPPGRSPTSITSEGVRGAQAEATTPTIEDPGTSWSSTASVRRSVGVAGAPPRGAGSAQTSPKTQRSARWPTSTTRSMLPVENDDSPQVRPFWA